MIEMEDLPLGNRFESKVECHIKGWREKSISGAKTMKKSKKFSLLF